MDESSFEQLVLTYKDRIFNLCYRYLANYEDADDCSQEVFVKAYRSLKDFRGDSAFGTWLYRIAVNTCKNKLVSREHRNRKSTRSLDAPLRTEEGEVAFEVKDDTFSPVRQAEEREKEALIQEAIASLPEEHREMVVLRDVEGLSYEDICRVTGLNIGTVKSKLSRAREALGMKLRRLY